MIYTPAEDSFLLAEQVKKFAFGDVVDIGTGSGIQAETAVGSSAVRKVLAADINKECVSFVKSKGINAVHSDLFSNVFGKYNTIIFNPPYLPKDSREDDESALSTTGGEKGYELFESFLKQAGNYLKDNGIILTILSDIAGKDTINNIIKENGFKIIELSSERVSFEEIFVYMLKKDSV